MRAGESVVRRSTRSVAERRGHQSTYRGHGFFAQRTEHEASHGIAQPGVTYWRRRVVSAVTSLHVLSTRSDREQLERGKGEPRCLGDREQVMDRLRSNASQYCAWMHAPSPCSHQQRKVTLVFGYEFDKLRLVMLLSATEASVFVRLPSATCLCPLTSE